MKVRDVQIDAYGWRARVFFPVTCYHVDAIVSSLRGIDCPEAIVNRVVRNLRKRELDTGFTFSNKLCRRSVVVIGKTSSPAQFLNSFEHELRHLVDDIATTCDMQMEGEEVAYLTGDVNALLWPDVHDFICCCAK